MLHQEKDRAESVRNAEIQAKQRIKNINLLQGTVDRQAALLRSQKEKINDVHTIGKIKMLEKLLKLTR